ncbi:MAG: hypothetical protein F4X64_01680 [Chloroflexi bacterium]|nr:hypothetical protein [Chloroflexota bacterium]
MTVKGLIVTLSVVAVVGAVAVMATLSLTAAPTAAQEPIPATPPPPTPTPELTSESDAKALDEMHEYCHDGEVIELEADVGGTEVVNGVEFKTVSLQWWSKRSYWDLPEGMLAYYRIQRQSHDKDDPTGDEWQTVETVTNTDVWKGVVETGHWHYRVGLLGLVSGDLVHECQTTQWAEDIFNVLTPQEELEQTCETAYVYHIGATVEPAPDGQGEVVTLEWRLDYYYPGVPEGTELTYRIERVRDDSGGSASSWEKVAEVSDMTTWNGLAEPGNWIYRVALVSLQAGGLVGQCEKPHWEKVGVWIPTAEERVREESDRDILINEATRCATDTLTENLSPAGREVVARHVEGRVSEVAADIDDNEELVTLAVLFCADGELFSGYGLSFSAQMYILLMLFDEGYY